MKRITKADATELDSLAALLRDKGKDVADAVERFNEKMAEAGGEVESVVTEYNELLTLAGEWVESVASQIRSYVDDRTEKWQEGDKGQAYHEWIAAYEDFDYSPITVDFPSEVDSPEMEHADAIDGLPQEPE